MLTLTMVYNCAPPKVGSIYPELSNKTVAFADEPLAGAFPFSDKILRSLKQKDVVSKVSHRHGYGARVWITFCLLSSFSGVHH